MHISSSGPRLAAPFHSDHFDFLPLPFVFFVFFVVQSLDLNLAHHPYRRAKSRMKSTSACTPARGIAL